MEVLIFRNAESWNGNIHIWQHFLLISLGDEQAYQPEMLIFSHNSKLSNICICLIWYTGLGNS